MNPDNPTPDRPFRSMDTAPRTGEWIEATVTETDQTMRLRWQDAAWRSFTYAGFTPTGWRPLVPPADELQAWPLAKLASDWIEAAEIRKEAGITPDYERALQCCAGQLQKLLPAPLPTPAKGGEGVAAGRNPTQLTLAQVGDGWRLLTEAEHEAWFREQRLVPNTEYWTGSQWYRFQDGTSTPACEALRTRLSPEALTALLQPTTRKEEAPCAANPNAPADVASLQSTDSTPSNAPSVASNAAPTDVQRVEPVAATPSDGEMLDAFAAMVENEHQSAPTFEDGKWGYPYLVTGDGGLGGGVGRVTFDSLRAAIANAMKGER